MSSHAYTYLDGNAAAGELNKIFAFEITAAEGQCAHCGTVRRFAEVHVFMECPGIVARCPSCGNVMLRLVDTGKRTLLDMSGMACCAVETQEFEESGW